MARQPRGLNPKGQDQVRAGLSQFPGYSMPVDSPTPQVKPTGAAPLPQRAATQPSGMVPGSFQRTVNSPSGPLYGELFGLSGNASSVADRISGNASSSWIPMSPGSMSNLNDRLAAEFPAKGKALELWKPPPGQEVERSGGDTEETSPYPIVPGNASTWGDGLKLSGNLYVYPNRLSQADKDRLNQRIVDEWGDGKVRVRVPRKFWTTGTHTAAVRGEEAHRVMYSGQQSQAIATGHLSRHRIRSVFDPENPGKVDEPTYDERQAENQSNMIDYEGRMQNSQYIAPTQMFGASPTFQSPIDDDDSSFGPRRHRDMMFEANTGTSWGVSSHDRAVSGNDWGVPIHERTINRTVYGQGAGSPSSIKPPSK